MIILDLLDNPGPETNEGMTIKFCISVSAEILPTHIVKRNTTIDYT